MRFASQSSRYKRRGIPKGPSAGKETEVTEWIFHSFLPHADASEFRKPLCGAPYLQNA